MSRITLKDLENKLAMIQGIAERFNRLSVSNNHAWKYARIQSGPGGKRIVIIAPPPNSGIYEVTCFMPARELNIYLSGAYAGLSSC